MKITINKSFAERKDLDDYIRTTFGDDMNANKDVSFESTGENLKQLQLSESSTIWGVKVKEIVVADVAAPTPIISEPSTPNEIVA